MRNVDIVIPDLFLPQDISADACAGLPVPALEKMLARATRESLSKQGGASATLEEWLCRKFGIARQMDEPIAPVTLIADGVQPGSGYWLRADPVHLQMERTQLRLHPDVVLSANEAEQLCTSLNRHFYAEGMCFFSPHPQRWYLKLESVPEIITSSLAQVSGRNVYTYLPKGKDALRWHKILNEIQMVFFEHEINHAREERGDLPVNSVWLWGGGSAVTQAAPLYNRVGGDSFLAGAFAQATGVPSAKFPGDLNLPVGEQGDMLIAWEGLRLPLLQGDLHAWRDSIQCLEQSYLAPLWKVLCQGRIREISLHVPCMSMEHRFVLTGRSAWKLWCLPKSLGRYTLGEV